MRNRLGVVLSLVMGWCLALYGSTVKVESDEARYDGDRIYLEGRVHVENDMGTVDAQRATIDTLRDGDTWHPVKILLEGEVRMRDLEHQRFALADRVEIDPQQRVMEFQASPGGHVLFLDMNRHMQLAAQRIRAEQGEQEKVQGFGDVRCLFGEEELQRLNLHFGLGREETKP